MDKQSGKMKRGLGAIAAAAGLVAVCAPCCAPLIAAAGSGLSAAFGMGAYVDDPLSWQGAALAALLAAPIGLLVWRLTARCRACRCASACNT
jgi:integral membrane sensor domain MASE1